MKVATLAMGTTLSMRVAIIFHEGKLDCHYLHNMGSYPHTIDSYPQGQGSYLHNKGNYPRRAILHWSLPSRARRLPS